MRFKGYVIECITNLHVGSGDTNYGIVDNLVQRDPVSKYPIIHSSSIKGALREYFEKNCNAVVDDVFGKGGDDSETGTHKFLSADLLAIPVRSSFRNYVLGLNKHNIDNLNRKADLLTGTKICADVPDVNQIYTTEVIGKQFAEEFEMAISNQIPTFVNGINHHTLASFDIGSYDTLMAHLPVIARNRLGEQKNLWYEEIVPHKTLFVTFIGASLENFDFDRHLEEGIIQIGANASVGYGLCKFHKILMA